MELNMTIEKQNIEQEANVEEIDLSSVQPAAAPAGEMEELVLSINRCSKVVKGGRNFSFGALVVVGDRNGKVGYGYGKANEVSDAIRKAQEAAKKHLVTIPRFGTTIPHSVLVKYSGSKILLRPA